VSAPAGRMTLGRPHSGPAKAGHSRKSFSVPQASVPHTGRQTPPSGPPGITARLHPPFISRWRRTPMGKREIDRSASACRSIAQIQLCGTDAKLKAHKPRRAGFPPRRASVRALRSNKLAHSRKNLLKRIALFIPPSRRRVRDECPASYSSVQAGSFFIC
jgi:hypothetical protein